MTRVSIPFKETGLNMMNSAGVTRLGRVQRFEVTADLPNTAIMELGSDRMVGRIFDIPEISATVSSIDVGSRTVFALAGRNWSSEASSSYVTLNDLRYVCLAQPFKSQGTSNDVARTLVVPAAKVDSISLNYTVGGDATEDFTFMGTNRLFLRYDAVLVSGTVTGGQLTWTGNALQLRNGNYFVALYSQDNYLPNEVATASTATSITFDTTRVPNGTNVWAIIHRDETNQWDYTYNLTPATMPVGLRGWGVEVYLTRTSPSSQRSRVYRAQSCTVNANFNSQRINELGTESTVGYVDTIPEVTGTLEILKHDFRLVEQLSNNATTTSDNDWDASILNGGGWGIEIVLWRRAANRSTALPEKTIIIPNIEVTRDMTSSQTNQDVMYTVDWSSRDAVVQFYRNRPA